MHPTTSFKPRHHAPCPKLSPALSRTFQGRSASTKGASDVGAEVAACATGVAGDVIWVEGDAIGAAGVAAGVEAGAIGAVAVALS
eukprot:4116476-Alexandrium_andersonii.AAC.1